MVCRTAFHSSSQFSCISLARIFPFWHKFSCSFTVSFTFLLSKNEGRPTDDGVIIAFDSLSDKSINEEDDDLDEENEYFYEIELISEPSSVLGKEQQVLDDEPLDLLFGTDSVSDEDEADQRTTFNMSFDYESCEEAGHSCTRTEESRVEAQPVQKSKPCISVPGEVLNVRKRVNENLNI